MEIDPLTRVREVCLSLPETTEKLAWGEPTFRIRNKMFATFANADSHHGGGRDALWCHAPEGAQRGLVDSAPDRFFIPPYVGKRGWIGMWLDAVSDDELHIHVREAYRVVAPLKLLKLMDG